MAEIKNFPNNVDEYIGAQNVMKWLHGRTSGVFGADGNLSVTANGNMTVRVSDGVGWLANDKADGTVFWNDTKEQTGSELQLTIPLANAVSPRIDRVVVSWDTVDYAAKPRIEVLKGTAASTPVAPALTNNSLLRQISLARVYVGAAVSKITADNITDERLDESVCGLVTDWISVDTRVMQAAFEAFMKKQSDTLEAFEAENYAAFNTWFNAIKGQLSTDAAGKLNDRIDGLATISMNLRATGWSGTGPYRQRVSIATMTSDQNFGPMFIVPTGNQKTDAANAEALGCLSYGVTGNGYVDIYCYDQKPDITFTVYASGRI